jgi:hypothetical protein
MCGAWRGHDVAGVEGGEFILPLILRQKVASLYWRPDAHTHTHTLDTDVVEPNTIAIARLYNSSAMKPKAPVKFA